MQACVSCGGFGQIALLHLLPPVNLCESLQLCWQTTQDDAIRHEQLDVVQLLVKYRGRPSSDEELQTLPCFAPLCVLLLFWMGRILLPEVFEMLVLGRSTWDEYVTWRNVTKSVVLLQDGLNSSR